jgi:hypothetical protein
MIMPCQMPHLVLPNERLNCGSNGRLWGGELKGGTGWSPPGTRNLKLGRVSIAAYPCKLIALQRHVHIKSLLRVLCSLSCTLL